MASCRISSSPAWTSRWTRPSGRRSRCSATSQPDCVIENLTLPVLYEAPLMLERRPISSDIVCRELHLALRPVRPDRLERRCWQRIAAAQAPREHRAWWASTPGCTTLIFPWRRPCPTRAMRTARRCTSSGWTAEELNAETLRDDILRECDGILVPGGFGGPRHRGYDPCRPLCPRATAIPYFGICLGMQIAVIEYRTQHAAAMRTRIPLSSIPTARTTVIDLMPDQQGNLTKGRHHAPGRLPLLVSSRARVMAQAYGAEADPASGTATAMSSTTSTAPRSSEAGLVHRGHLAGRPAGGGGGAAAATAFMSACSTIPSSKAVPTAPIRCSAPLWRTRCVTRTRTNKRAYCGRRGVVL